MTHIYVSKLTISGSDNVLSPGRRHAIIWTKDGILLIGPLGTNFSDILIYYSCIFIQKNAFENVVWKMAAILSGPQCVKPEFVSHATHNSKWQRSERYMIQDYSLTQCNRTHVPQITRLNPCELIPRIVDFRNIFLNYSWFISFVKWRGFFSWYLVYRCLRIWLIKFSSYYALKWPCYTKYLVLS